MISRLPCLGLLLAGLLAGCTTFTRVELDQVRGRGVSPAVVTKLDRGGVLTPGDIIELHRRGISDRMVLRQLNVDGVDYLLTRQDVSRMRKAGVSSQVVAATVNASDRFAAQYRTAEYDVRYGNYYGDPFCDSWGYDPYYYGGYSLSYGYYGSGRHHGSRGRDAAPFFSPRRVFR